MPRQTHTVAELEVSAGAYDEIAQLLRDAGYDHVFRDGVIDMSGIGLTREEPPEMSVSVRAANDRYLEETAAIDARYPDIAAKVNAFAPAIYLDLDARLRESLVARLRLALESRPKYKAVPIDIEDVQAIIAALEEHP